MGDSGIEGLLLYRAMSNFARTADALGDAASIVKRAAELLMYVAAVVALVCAIGLIVAGFYGIVHKGNDFGSFGSGHGGRGESDVIVLPHLLS